MLACVAMLVVQPAHAETHVELLRTWPAGDTVTLHRNQTFYVHLAYRSDQPVHIWVRPYFEGKQVNAGSNPSRVYPAGSGEALGWFFLSEPGTQVDELKVTAGDGSNNGTPVVATFPVSITNDDAPAADAAQPAWLATLRAADQAAQRADYEKAMNAPVSTGDIAFFNGFMLTMFALGLIGFAGPAWGLWRWRGGWRLAALLPAATMAFVVLRLFIDTARDPTSHNLWPFEILIWGGFSCLWMLAVVLVRKLSGVRRA
jgi:hypothetical protein